VGRCAGGGRSACPGSAFSPPKPRCQPPPDDDSDRGGVKRRVCAMRRCALMPNQRSFVLSLCPSSPVVTAMLPICHCCRRPVSMVYRTTHHTIFTRRCSTSSMLIILPEFKREGRLGAEMQKCYEDLFAIHWGRCGEAGISSRRVEWCLQAEYYNRCGA